MEVAMNTCRSTLVLVSLALIAQISEARPQGMITGLSVSPSPKACALETIKVTGTGSCGTFTLDLGDGTPIVHLPGNFPISVYHYYSKAKPITLTAQGQGNCSGMSSLGLQVVGPKITNMFLFSQVTPDGYVLLTGENFGNLQGQIYLHLTNPGPNPPDIALQNIHMGDSYASGEVPDSVTGVLDQQASLTVAAQCGAVSDPYQTNFTAKRDVALAPPDRISCWVGGGTASDSCGASGNARWPPECLGGPFAVGGGAVSGYHASGWGFHGHSGSDKFWGNLNNGWIVASVVNFQQFNVGSGSHVDLVDPDGQQVNWYADNCGMASYTADMLITGPAGLPF
jgi:hypothetical protein